MPDIKFKKPKQFPEDEILNEDERLARGWMTVEQYDNDGELIPVSDIKRALNTWMKRGAPISDMHSNRIVGKGLRWLEEEHPDTKTPAIKIDYNIFSDYSVDDAVWNQIKSGERKGLSLGGRSTAKPEYKMNDQTGEVGRELTGMELYEIASVDEPCNNLALNTDVNYLAKGNKTKDIKPPTPADIADPEKKKQKADGDYGPHSHDESNPEGLHSHTEDKKKQSVEDNVKEFTEEDFASGLEDEGKEHPGFDADQVRQVVLDHLSEDPKYYSNKKSHHKDFIKCLLEKRDVNNEIMKCLFKPINRKI